GRGRAVEDHRVVTALAFDVVTAVAGVPDEAVVAGAQVGDVVAAVAVDRVVARPGEEQLRAGSSEQRVVPAAPADRRRDAIGERAVYLVDPDEVVTRPRIDDDRRDLVELNLEVRRPVVTFVDVQDIAAAGIESKRDLV